MQVAYTRKALEDQTFTIVDPVFQEMAEARGIYTKELTEEIARTGSVQELERVPQDMKELFKTAYEIPPAQHVRMQAAIQKYTDNAVSKTVNLPSSATVQDVREIFLLAYKLKCKGITVFRQGSRRPVLSSGLQGHEYVTMRERPKVTFGRTEKFRTGCGSLYVHVNQDDQKRLVEVFSNLGTGGGCPAQSEATARLVSLALRCRVDPREIVHQLRGIRCPTACSRMAAGRSVDVLSCPDAIARAIEGCLGQGKETTDQSRPMGTCPRCGGKRERSRCGVCLSCFDAGCEGT